MGCSRQWLGLESERSEAKSSEEQREKYQSFRLSLSSPRHDGLWHLLPVAGAISIPDAK